MIKEEDQLRTVAFYRVDGDGNKPQDERLYRPFKESPSVTIPEAIECLGNIYDLIVLHDPYDGCLLLNLQDGAEEKVTKLPCKLKHEHI